MLCLHTDHSARSRNQKITSNPLVSLPDVQVLSSQQKSTGGASKCKTNYFLIKILIFMYYHFSRTSKYMCFRLSTEPRQREDSPESTLLKVELNLFSCFLFFSVELSGVVKKYISIKSTSIYKYLYIYILYGLACYLCLHCWL